MKKYKTTYNSYIIKRLERKTKIKFLLTVIICVMIGYFVLIYLIPNFIGSLSFLNAFKNDSPVRYSSNQVSLAPPVLIIPFEATNTPILSIKGYATPKNKVEIYLDEELQGITDVQDDGTFIVEKIILKLGQNNLFGRTVDSQGNVSLPSKTIKVFYSNEKPPLEVSSPEDNQIIHDNKITVVGHTLPDCIVFINKKQIIVNTEGSFSDIVELTEGENDLIIQAVNKAGNSTQIIKTITYQP